MDHFSSGKCIDDGINADFTNSFQRRPRDEQKKRWKTRHGVFRVVSSSLSCRSSLGQYEVRKSQTNPKQIGIFPENRRYLYDCPE